MRKNYREFSAQFRLQVVQRILGGESVTRVHLELDIKRSMLYRWTDAYRKEGVAGLERKRGRPPGARSPGVRSGMGEEEALREQVALLERKVGQQAVQLDFFRRAFKRVKESSQASHSAGATASTRKSGR